MKAVELYKKLEKDFIVPGLKDDWAGYMESVYDFLTANFKKRSIGLVCDFTKEIDKVYTAVFPSAKVMKEILARNETDIMLFVHHPSIWDIRKTPEVYQQMDRKLLEEFKRKRISIYNLHVPLDNFGEYSTSVSLSRELNVKVEKPFALYFGALAGVFGKTNLATVQNLRKKFQNTVGHKVSLYNYGDNVIKNKTVAIVAGGGLDETIEEIAQNNVNVLITGIALKNDHSKKAHDYAQKYKINILGGTHYSTEKFACINICDYFKKLGLQAEFIKDKPAIEDI